MSDDESDLGPNFMPAASADIKIITPNIGKPPHSSMLMKSKIKPVVTPLSKLLITTAHHKQSD